MISAPLKAFPAPNLSVLGPCCFYYMCCLSDELLVITAASPFIFLPMILKCFALLKVVTLTNWLFQPNVRTPLRILLTECCYQLKAKKMAPDHSLPSIKQSVGFLSVYTLTRIHGICNFGIVFEQSLSPDERISRLKCSSSYCIWRIWRN